MKASNLEYELNGSLAGYRLKLEIHRQTCRAKLSEDCTVCCYYRNNIWMIEMMLGRLGMGQSIELEGLVK